MCCVQDTLDGVPLADPDFDGEPLVTAASMEDSDYDGIPSKC